MPATENFWRNLPATEAARVNDWCCSARGPSDVPSPPSKSRKAKQSLPAARQSQTNTPELSPALPILYTLHTHLHAQDNGEVRLFMQKDELPLFECHFACRYEALLLIRNLDYIAIAKPEVLISSRRTQRLWHAWNTSYCHGRRQRSSAWKRRKAHG